MSDAFLPLIILLAVALTWREHFKKLRTKWRLRFSSRGSAPGERVDPTSFPEDEFPIFCMICDYELRGLPEPRCPECGTPFDRGRLLVRSYVERDGMRAWLLGTPDGQRYTRVFRTAVLAMLIVWLAVNSTSRWIAWPPNIDRVLMWFLPGFLVVFFDYRRRKSKIHAKREQVLAALAHRGENKALS